MAFCGLPNISVTQFAVISMPSYCCDPVVHTSPTQYKNKVIVPFASLSNHGYAAHVFIADPAGQRRGFTSLGYFASERAACCYAVSYAKAHIDGGPPRKPPFTSSISQ